jgi:hypothetical protein
MKNHEPITLPSGKSLVLVIQDQLIFDRRGLMDSASKQKWIDALKSGKYKQGYDCLVSDDGDAGFTYCCLGVKAQIDGCSTKGEGGQLGFVFKGEFSLDYLPPEYETGLCSKGNFNGFFVEYGACDYYALAQLNDARYSFEDIAHIINLLF